MREETGLTELSKIRKFVFADISNTAMSAPSLLEAYKTYWLEMENSFFSRGGLEQFEKFLCDFLTIQKNGVLPKQNELMKDFAHYFTNACRFQKKELVLRNIYRYSSYFMQISYGKIKDEKIKEKVDEINSLEAKDAYPFLMEVFEDYDYAHINKNMLLDILNTVIGFIHERNAVSPSKNAVSFAGLSNEINKMMILKDYIPKFVTEEESDTLNSRYL